MYLLENEPSGEKGKRRSSERGEKEERSAEARPCSWSGVSTERKKREMIRVKRRARRADKREDKRRGAIKSRFNNRGTVPGGRWAQSRRRRIIVLVCFGLSECPINTVGKTTSVGGVPPPFCCVSNACTPANPAATGQAIRNRGGRPAREAVRPSACKTILDFWKCTKMMRNG